MQSVHITTKVVSSTPVHGVKKQREPYAVANSVCREDKIVDPDHNCFGGRRGHVVVGFTTTYAISAYHH